MDIVFESSKFEEECNNQRLRLKKHGADRAKRILQRLDDLRDANKFSADILIPHGDLQRFLTSIPYHKLVKQILFSLLIR